MGQLTIRAAADRLGVSYSTLKRWVHLGQVRTTLTGGGHHRVSEQEVDRLLAHQPAGQATTSEPPAGDTLIGLSARNRLLGVVEEVRVDGLLAQIRLRVGGQRLTAVITSDAVHDLQLKRGDEALAVIKSTEVMVARSERPVPPPRRRRR